MTSTSDQTDPDISLATKDRPSSQAAKTQRVLACLLCQQRKVKCDRRQPCTSCVKFNVQCIPAAPLVFRQRRRRFPERELLDRVRHYESLLRENNINFEPLHKDYPTTVQKSLNTDDESRDHGLQDDGQRAPSASSDQPLSPPVTIKSEPMYKAKNIWQAMNQRAQSQHSDDDSSDSMPDDLQEALVKDFKERNRHNDHFLLGLRDEAVDVFSLHPEQIQIFRLWQIYLDNVNPLLKVTHTPTLQAGIIDAASNLAIIDSTLAALMFSIYCMAILSLNEDDCQTMFGSPKDSLLKRFQFGCRQALLDCAFLSSVDLDCLTALYLYLLSIRPIADPYSLSSLLAVAIRIAQRMGLPNESTNEKCPALEGEMRRRLWWSLALFDARICEMSDHKTVVLIPTWDCKTPLNVNDFDLRPGMKDPPASHEKSSEAIFAVLRSKMGDFVRHSSFYLDFVNPVLKAITKAVQGSPVLEGGEMTTIEKVIEDSYLQFCNSENQLHFMTIWMARSYLAKYRLLEHYSRSLKSPAQQTDAQRGAAISDALCLLECDSKLMKSPLTKGYKWFLDFHFPFSAYIHIIQDLRVRSVHQHAEQAWEIMSENYEARLMFVGYENNLLFKVFSKMILQAWEACEVAFRQSGKILIPRIVSDVQLKVLQTTQNATGATKDANDVSDMNFSMSMPTDPNPSNLFYGMGGRQGYYLGSDSSAYQTVSGHADALDIDLNNLNWTSMNWNPLYRGDW